MVGPIVGASVATRPMIGAMIGCLSRGKMVKAEANTVGIMPPPMKPCSARHRIISWIEPAWAHMKLMSVKPPAEMVKISRVENTRERKPESGIMITSATR